MNKSQILELITKLPNDINEEDVIENLFFKAHVDAGIKSLNDGNVVTNEQIKQKYKIK